MLPLRDVVCPLPTALVGDSVVAAAGARAIRTPIGGDEAVLLQPFKRGVQGGLLEAILPIGALLDIFIDLITIVVPAHQLC